MNFLYKAAVIWVMSLLAAGPIPLAVHVAVCHHDQHSSHCHHHEASASSCEHHDHASPSEESELALIAGAHDHECSVCQTLSQTASSNKLEQFTLSQPLTVQATIALDGVYDAPTSCGYLVRGPPC